jgi:prolipoprotein diacylglyceryltransferase
MKNKFQIYSIIVVFLYFIPKLLKIKGFTENIWYDIICFIAIITLGFLELKRLLKFDKLNNTNKFKQRLLLVITALIIFIITRIYLVN